MVISSRGRLYPKHDQSEGNSICQPVSAIQITIHYFDWYECYKILKKHHYLLVFWFWFFVKYWSPGLMTFSKIGWGVLLEGKGKLENGNELTFPNYIDIHFLYKNLKFLRFFFFFLFSLVFQDIEGHFKLLRDISWTPLWLPDHKFSRSLLKANDVTHISHLWLRIYISYWAYYLV